LKSSKRGKRESPERGRGLFEGNGRGDKYETTVLISYYCCHTTRIAVSDEKRKLVLDAWEE
jgi:hypothetical protein